jgi:hypothetical protein
MTTGTSRSPACVAACSAAGDDLISLPHPDDQRLDDPF